MTKRRASGKAARLLIGLGVAAVGIELLARWNARREQKKREHLGDLLYREVRGSGPAVLFVPGFQGSSRYWGKRFDELQTVRRLIFVDIVGFGRSPWPHIDYSVEDHIGYLRRTLEAEGVRSKLTIVAHSFGTILATLYAARYPAEVDRLVLMGVPLFDDEEEARSRLWEMSPIAALFSLNLVLSHVSCTLMCAFRPLLREIVPLLRPDLDAAVASDGVLHMWSSIDRTLRNVLLGASIETALMDAGRKTTIIHGRIDTVTPLDRIKGLAAESGAELIVTDDEHHTYVSSSSDVIVHAITGGGEASAPVSS